MILDAMNVETDWEVDRTKRGNVVYAVEIGTYVGGRREGVSVGTVRSELGTSGNPGHWESAVGASWEDEE